MFIRVQHVTNCLPHGVCHMLLATLYNKPIIMSFLSDKQFVSPSVAWRSMFPSVPLALKGNKAKFFADML